MKKIFILAALTLLGASCSDSNNETGDEPTPTTGLAAPQVTLGDVTATSFTATWPAVDGAEEYRYEVTTAIDGGNGTSAIATGYTPETTLTIDALKPATEYQIRIAARADGVTSNNWFTGTVTTLGDEGGLEISFSITPCEKYHSSGYVYPFARVTPSNTDVYYWVSAIPSDQLEDASTWMQEDIDYYLSQGETWDSLLSAGLICQGEAESALFSFADYGDFTFIVAAVGKTMSGIELLSAPSHSYTFWTESPDTPMQHLSTYEDFTGDWVLTTAGTTAITNDNMLNFAEGEIFPVTITATDDGGLQLEGWGGTRNSFSTQPLRLDYQTADDGYNTFSISFPQQIPTEDGVTWEYASWFIFSGTIEGAQQTLYMPYDSETAATIPSWSLGFTGFVANLNKTVLKIFGQEYTDSSSGEGAYMMGIWPIGRNANDEVVLLNGTYNEPIGFYYLTRKEVAEGKVNVLPDVSQQSGVQAKSPATALHQTRKASAKPAGNRCFQRVL